MYRPTAGIIVKHNDLILVGKSRVGRSGGFWTMPQGGIDEGESPLQGAKRELLEEMGIKETDLSWNEKPYLYLIKIPEHKRTGFYIGNPYQKYHWFLAKADTKPKVTLDPEEYYEAYKWEMPENLPSETVSFKEEMYRNVLFHFGLLKAFN